jgi:anaerobic selenocysteine-containing dehydrogenase
LVQEDGYFIRAEPEGDEAVGKPLVWDEASGSAMPYDTEGIEPALEGEFTVDGVNVRPSFELFVDHVQPYTPEWAADVTGLPADKIWQIGKDLADNAMIGATVERDGVTIPYRPVGIMTYHIAQQELGFQAVRAMTMISMLLGAVGAVGGQLSDFTWKVHKNYKGLDNISIKEETNVYLKNSKFYPINSNNSSLAAKVIVDPEKYGATKIPEMVIVHMANPLGSFPDYDANYEAYKKFKFVAVIDPWLSRTADLFADVVLPAATMEKYEGPMSASDQYTDGTAMRIPVMDPMFNSKGDIDIYLDLCEKADILYGEKGYLAQVNKALKLEGEHAIPTDTKPTTREIFDIWAKAQGIEEGIAYFEENGVKVKGPVAATKRYGYVTDPPFGGALHRLYGESLLGYQQTMQEMGSDEIYWQDYTAFPTWRDLTLEGSPSEYDLYLTSFHKIEFKQARTPIPLLTEMAPHQILEMNSKAAQARGLADGDMAWIESHNAVTGETRRQQVQVRYRESIRPDTVGMSHHYGEYAKHPTLKSNGASANSLFFTGEGYVANTADQTYLVKVKVEKA